MRFSFFWAFNLARNNAFFLACASMFLLLETRADSTSAMPILMPTKIWLILFPHLPTQNSAETAEKRVALGMKCTEMFDTAKIEINTIIHMQR